MGTIKRLLTFTLSTVLLVGGMILKTSAAELPFTDSDQITNTEAVAVMNAIGVFQGSGGAFSPEGILTREQAAKIICYMLGGQEEAESIEADEYLFTDVAATRWSAPYIAYCVKNGILSGDGSGQFYPEQSLTGGAFAKMLLVALGYDPSIEGYTGNDWILNVASTALSLGIVPQNMNLLEELDRQDAAQMCYKLLQCDMVRYKGINDLITDRPAIGKVDNYQEYDYNQSEDSVQQFCEAYFPELKLVAAYDDFGRPGSCWTWQDETVYYTAYPSAATFTSDTDPNIVAFTLNRYYLKDCNLYSANKRITTTQKVSFSANLRLTLVGIEGTSTETAVRIEGQSTADYLAGLTGNGRLVELYADEKNVITDIVVVSYKADVVTNVTIAPGKIAYTLGGTSYVDYKSGEQADTVVVRSVIRAGDTVTYTIAGGVAYLYPTSQIKGTLTAAWGDTVQISGIGYPLGCGVAGISDLTIGTQGVFYLDQFGNVVDMRTEERTVGYSQVLSAVGEYTPANEELGIPVSDPRIVATVVNSDGSVGQYQVALHTLTEADLEQNQPTAANMPSVRLQPGDVVVQNTNLLVYDLSAGNSSIPQLINGAASRLSGVWISTLEGNTITLQALPEATSAMSPYAPYQTGQVDLSQPHGANQMDGYELMLDSNTIYVIYDSNTGATSQYIGAGLPAEFTSLKHVCVVLQAYSPELGGGLVVFSLI